MLKITLSITALTFSFLTHAEVAFRQTKIKIKDQTLLVELADTPSQHAQGLMFRKKLDDGRGMIFVFPNAEIRSFWMKNTFIPLSVGFFDENKKLIDIQDMAATISEMQSDLPSYQSRGPAMYALEVNQGWFKKHKIKPGDRFDFLH